MLISVSEIRFADKKSKREYVMMFNQQGRRRSRATKNFFQFFSISPTEQLLAAQLNN